jgi:hypothetical protein
VTRDSEHADAQLQLDVCSVNSRACLKTERNHDGDFYEWFERRSTECHKGVGTARQLQLGKRRMVPHVSVRQYETCSTGRRSSWVCCLSVMCWDRRHGGQACLLDSSQHRVGNIVDGAGSEGDLCWQRPRSVSRLINGRCQHSTLSRDSTFGCLPH